MSPTKQGPAFASYRGTVTELIEAGHPFGDIERAIDEAAELTIDEKAALWLLAFSRSDRADQHRAVARLAVVG
jgi:hypothetical protein